MNASKCSGIIKLHREKNHAFVDRHILKNGYDILFLFYKFNLLVLSSKQNSTA